MAGWSRSSNRSLSGSRLSNHSSQLCPTGVISRDFPLTVIVTRVTESGKATALGKRIAWVLLLLKTGVIVICLIGYMQWIYVYDIHYWRLLQVMLILFIQLKNLMRRRDDIVPFISGSIADLRAGGVDELIGQVVCQPGERFFRAHPVFDLRQRFL